MRGADSYEIAVFSIQNPDERIITDTLYDELLQISAPTLTTLIPAPALSWTPTKEQGFTPGKTYAWHVRSLVQNSPGEWSTAAFFKVPKTTIANLDTAVDEAVADFLTGPDENFIFWSGLEERIAEMVADKVSESSASISTSRRNSSDANLRGGDEGASGTNVWYGYQAGNAIATQGDGYTKDNVFIGRYAGANTYDGIGGVYDNADYNVFVGNASGYSNTSGNHNAFVGFNSGRNNTIGYDNAFFGDRSGSSNTTGENNTFFGSYSGSLNITGENNTFLGCNSGACNTTGSNNVFIGYGAGYYETGSNKLYIANSDTASPLIYGDFAAKQLKVNGTLEFTTAFATSDQRWKKDIKPLDNSLAKVVRLNGKSYFWRRDEFPDKGFSGQRQLGLIAQEVEKNSSGNYQYRQRGIQIYLLHPDYSSFG